MNTPLGLSQSFLIYIQAANRISAPLQAKDWLRLAIRSSAGAGNPKGSILALSPAGVAGIEKVIGKLFEQLEREQAQTQAIFDRHFLDAVGEVIQLIGVNSPETAFSFGRAQKILTVYLKYAYAESWIRPEGQRLVQDWRRFFHVPVDRQTFLFFFRQPAHRTVSLLPNGRLVSWKWSLDEMRYTKIQRAARVFASGSSYKDSLHFEMARIWTQPASRSAGVGSYQHSQ